jgi:hypothetical protein
MASTYSTSLKLTLIGDGDQAGIWGQTTNTNLGTLLEQAITGVVSVNMADANYTLTSFNGVTDEARNAVIVVTGANNGIRNLIPPVLEKLYTISNQTTGGYAIRVIGASGTGVNIPNGVTALVYCNGTNFVSGLSGTSGNFTAAGNLVATANVTANNATITNTLSAANIAASNATFVGGTVNVPTVANSSNTTVAASTAFVKEAVTAATGTLGTMSSQNANAVTITGGTINGVTGTSSGLIVGSATNLLTGGTIASSVTATTQSTSDNSTKVATTAYVQNQITATTGPQVKAYISFSGGPVPEVRSFYNLSISYVSQGIYYFAFTNALANINYIVTGNGSINTDSNGATIMMLFTNQNSYPYFLAPTTSGFYCGWYFGTTFRDPIVGNLTVISA